MGIGLAIRVGIVLAIIAAVWWALYALDHYCNAACREAQAAIVELNDVIEAAQERASALALLWADGLNKVEVRYVERQQERAATFADIRTRAAVATGSGGIVLDAAARRVLDDASSAANSTRAAAAESDQGPAAAISPVTGDAIVTPEAFGKFYIDAAEAYRDAYDKWAAAVAAYETLRLEVEAERKGKQ